jgi:hypothetical protein
MTRSRHRSVPGALYSSEEDEDSSPGQPEHTRDTVSTTLSVLQVLVVTHEVLQVSHWSPLQLSTYISSIDGGKAACNAADFVRLYPMTGDNFLTLSEEHLQK